MIIRTLWVFILLVLVGCSPAEDEERKVGKVKASKPNEYPHPADVVNDTSKFIDGQVELDYRYWGIPISILVPPYGEVSALDYGDEAIVFYEFDHEGRKIGITMGAYKGSSSINLDSVMEDHQKRLSSIGFEEMIDEYSIGYVYRYKVNGSSDIAFDCFHTRDDYLIEFTNMSYPHPHRYDDLMYLYGIAEKAK